MKTWIKSLFQRKVAPFSVTTMHMPSGEPLIIPPCIFEAVHDDPIHLHFKNWTDSLFWVPYCYKCGFVSTRVMWKEEIQPRLEIVDGEIRLKPKAKAPHLLPQPEASNREGIT